MGKTGAPRPGTPLRASHFPTAPTAAIIPRIPHPRPGPKLGGRSKRAALISHTVTKGLDPTAEMKDSGIEWLGEIPVHWDLLQVKRLSIVKRGASPRPIDDPIYFDENGEYSWVRIADVTSSKRYLEKTTQRLSLLGKSLSVPMQPGSLFLSIAGSVGKPIITKIKCCIHDGFVYFPRFKGSPEFLYYIFVSGQPYGGLGKLGTQLNLNTDTVGAIHIGYPSHDEQGKIVAFLDRETAHIDTLIEKVKKSVVSPPRIPHLPHLRRSHR